ncbi:hypothetical protein L0152_30900 [bacterium]|nr:hypothetical protein [bacterium]
MAFIKETHELEPQEIREAFEKLIKGNAENASDLAVMIEAHGIYLSLLHHFAEQTENKIFGMLFLEQRKVYKALKPLYDKVKAQRTEDNR